MIQEGVALVGDGIIGGRRHNCWRWNHRRQNHKRSTMELENLQ
jgi:hypothetical protein